MRRKKNKKNNIAVAIALTIEMGWEIHKKRIW
jgi:hypothetical protein